MRLFRFPQLLFITVATLTTGALAMSSWQEAHAQATGASGADALNEEGKQLLYDNKPSEAAAKFRQAIAISPEGRFYYNLCVAQYQEGRFGEAIASCDSVAPNGADATLIEKTAKFRTKITDEMARQGLTNPPTTPPTGPTDPGAPTPPVVTQPVVGAPPQAPTAPRVDLSSKYMWSLNGMLLLAKGSGFGFQDSDYDAGVGIQVSSDFSLNKPLSLGLQAFVTYYALPSTYDGIDKLAVTEIGVNGYKNICSGAICITPRLGLLAADFAPGNFSAEYEDVSYQSVGFTADLAAGMAVGPQRQGLVYLQAGYRGYASISADGAYEVGLEDSTAMSYIGIGYSHRFAKSWRDSPSAFTWRLE